MTVEEERKRTEADSNYEPTEFVLTNEIKELGITRVYTDYEEQRGGGTVLQNR